jgi:hypothetical protein
VPAPESGPLPRASHLSLSSCEGLSELITRLDAAVVAGGQCPKLVTATVKGVLEDVLQRKALVLPPAFFEARPDGAAPPPRATAAAAAAAPAPRAPSPPPPIPAAAYARRLLHRDPAGRYTAIVMCWGPGQQTPIHDHSGMWCVEGVVRGRIFFTNFVVEPSAGGGLFHATPVCTNWAGEGAAGCLIPPTDHHVLGNALPTTSATLHVYGGEMRETHVYLPAEPAGVFVEHVRQLRYTEPEELAAVA